MKFSCFSDFIHFTDSLCIHCVLVCCPKSSQVKSLLPEESLIYRGIIKIILPQQIYWRSCHEWVFVCFDLVICDWYWNFRLMRLKFQFLCRSKWVNRIFSPLFTIKCLKFIDFSFISFRKLCKINLKVKKKIKRLFVNGWYQSIHSITIYRTISQTMLS